MYAQLQLCTTIKKPIKYLGEILSFYPYLKSYTPKWWKSRQFIFIIIVTFICDASNGEGMPVLIFR